MVVAPTVAEVTVIGEPAESTTTVPVPPPNPVTNTGVPTEQSHPASQLPKSNILVTYVETSELLPHSKAIRISSHKATICTQLANDSSANMVLVFR